MFMTYLVMNKTFIMMQKFCLILVFMSVVIMVLLIIWRGMRGHWPLPCTPTCPCGAWVAPGWPMVILAPTPLILPTSITRRAWRVRGAIMAMIMCTTPIVMPVVIGLGPITTMGPTSVSIPIFCFRGWVQVRSLILTWAWWPMSAICGWRIIQVVRIIILPLFVLRSHISMTISMVMIIIMIVITMPPIIWTVRSRGGILVMILWIIWLWITAISCSLITARDIRVSHGSNIRVPHTIEDILHSKPLSIVLSSMHLFSHQWDVLLMFGGTANIFAFLTTLNLFSVMFFLFHI